MTDNGKLLKMYDNIERYAFHTMKRFFFFSVWGYNEKKMSSLRQFQP